MAWRAPSHYLNQWWLIHLYIYASLGLNELRQKSSNKNKRGFLYVVFVNAPDITQGNILEMLWESKIKIYLAIKKILSEDGG